LVGEGADVKSIWLGKIARTGNIELVKLFLSKGCSLDSRDNFENTALHKLDKNDLAVAKALVSAGADVHARNKFKQTPLHVSARGGKKDVVEYFLSKGADVDAKGHMGRTALHDVYDLSTAELLISSGANIEIQNGNALQMTPLYRQAEVGNVEIVKLLIEKGSDINKLCVNDYHALFVLNKNGVEIAKLFIERGLDINMTSKDGSTPLHACAQVGNAELIKYYLAVGANINATDNRGNLPIHKLAFQATPVAKVLLENGQDVNAKNNKGQTALHRAAGFGDIELIQYLISKSADVNVTDKDGVTPLYFAVKNNRREVVELLNGGN
jgi:ankyrin repeat protein